MSRKGAFNKKSYEPDTVSYDDESSTMTSDSTESEKPMKKMGGFIPAAVRAKGGVQKTGGFKGQLTKTPIKKVGGERKRMESSESSEVPVKKVNGGRKRMESSESSEVPAKKVNGGRKRMSSSESSEFPAKKVNRGSKLVTKGGVRKPARSETKMKPSNAPKRKGESSEDIPVESEEDYSCSCCGEHHSESEILSESDNTFGVRFAYFDDKFTFGYFNDFKLVIMEDNKYVNADELCNGYGKNFKNWLKLKESKELVNSLKEIKECGVDLTVVNGGKAPFKGTYIHPYLISHVAAWAEPSCAIYTSKIMTKYLVNEKFNKKFDEAQETLCRVLEENGELELRVGELECEVEDLRIERSKLVERIEDLENMPAPNDGYVWYIIKYNAPKAAYQYCSLRTTRKNLKSAIKKIKSKYSKMEIIHKIEKTLQYVDIWEELSLDLHDNPKIKVNRNEFNLKGFNEKKFIELIDEYNDEYMETTD
uniref:KilA-N domain-containing protein n=1 Tax=viral metagenome TaxID=1070528 RepID=A0A6C0CA14_9ZZZZ